MGQCDNTEAYDNFTSQWGRDSQTGRALILMGRPTNASNVSLDDVNMTEIIDEIRASFNESSASSRRRSSCSTWQLIRYAGEVLLRSPPLYLVLRRLPARAPLIEASHLRREDD